MTQLRRADLEAILRFLADVGGLEFDEPYPVEFLARLQDLVRCDAITYADLDYAARREYAFAGIGPDAGDDDEELYWASGPCPITQYRCRSGDLSAVRMSDVIARRRYHELPVYREYFRLAGLDHILDLGLFGTQARQRSFVLFRRQGAADFSERDRAVLETLRPHLYHLEEYAALRRRLSAELRAHDGNGERDVHAALTAREREIADLVAEGKTNAEIAAQLWVAPSTVKKHLEHIYDKLGVGRRAAVASARYASRGLPDQESQGRTSPMTAFSPAPTRTSTGTMELVGHYSNLD